MDVFAEFCKDAAGRHRGIDFWMTACQQGQPESGNRGGVETVTTGNNDQSSVVVALMRSRADRKDGIIGFGLTCVVSGRSSSSWRPIHGQFGRNKTLRPSRSASQTWRVQLARAFSFLAFNLALPSKTVSRAAAEPPKYYCRGTISRTEVKQALWSNCNSKMAAPCPHNP